MTGTSDEPSRYETVRRTSFSTRHLDEVGPVVARLYGDNDYELSRPSDDFRFQLAACEAGPLATGTVHYGVEGRCDLTSAGASFTTACVYAGSVGLSHEPYADRCFGSGGLWRYGAEPMGINFSADCTFGSLSIPQRSIAEAAAEVSDLDPGIDADQSFTEVRFVDDVAVDEPARRYWIDLMRFAHRQASATDSALTNPLIRAQLLRHLAGAALTVFPNTTMAVHYVGGAGHVGPATLRRAVAHIHAHAAQPLTVAEIAASAGIGVRALQQAFVRHHDCTPMAFVRQVRLERAHRELQAADPTGDDTVTAIARRWGFHHPGRFSATYAATYAVAPSDTLRS